MQKQRVELGCHTNMSQMKGISSASEYVQEAIKRNWKAIGIADFDSIQGLIEAEKYFRDCDIKIVHGIYLSVSDIEENKKWNSYKVLLIAKNNEGLKNINKLLTISNFNEYNSILEKDLKSHRKGLLIGTNSIEKMDRKFFDFLIIEPIYDAVYIRYPKFNNNLKVPEIVDKRDEKKNINKKIIEIGEKLNIPVVACSNPLFVNPNDKTCNEILNFEKSIFEKGYGSGRYLHTTEEMLEEFKYLGNKKAYEVVVENTNKIADMCEKLNPNEYKIYYRKIDKADEILKEKVWKKAHDIYGKDIPEICKSRINLELNSIIKNEFTEIYLLAHDVAIKSKKDGYLVGTRGGVGDSFVAFLLEITEYNPIEYNLPFEIFAGIDFDRKPYIDLVLSGDIQLKMHDYVKEKFGKDKVVYGGDITYISDIKAQDMTEKYCSQYKIDISDEEKKNIIKKLMGIKTGTDIHPGKLMIIPEDIDVSEITPLDKGRFYKKDIIKTHIPYKDIFSIFLEIDLLRNDAPTILHRLQELTKVDSTNISLYDKKVIKAISSKGVPNFSSDYVKGMINLVKPKSINEFVCILALSYGTGTWVDNAEELIKKGIANIDEVISNREDTMNYLVEFGIDKETSFKITEFIRKGKASKAKDENNYWFKYWQEYKKILKDHKVPEWFISSCEKIQYLFSKAQSIGYTLLAYKLAWYKAYYPEEFKKVMQEIKGEKKDGCI